MSDCRKQEAWGEGDAGGSGQVRGDHIGSGDSRSDLVLPHSVSAAFLLSSLLSFPLSFSLSVSVSLLCLLLGLSVPAFPLCLFLPHSVPLFSVLGFPCLSLSLVCSLFLSDGFSLLLLSLLSGGPSGFTEPQGQAGWGEGLSSALRCHWAPRGCPAKCQGQEMEAGGPRSAPRGESWDLCLGNRAEAAGWPREGSPVNPGSCFYHPFPSRLPQYSAHTSTLVPLRVCIFSFKPAS